MLLKKSTAANVPILMTDSSDHVTGKTGLTLTITASKDGAAFGSISPTVTELANGWYNLALTTSHTDTVGALLIHATGTGADPTDRICQVMNALPIEVSIRKNTAKSGFQFIMISQYGVPLTGLTVTATRSLDGAAFSACANSVSEISSGWYKIDLAAGDLNGDTVALKFSATGARDTDLTILTES